MRTIRLVALGLGLFASVAMAAQGPPEDGARSFNVRCAACHGGNGNGTDHGPSLLAFVATNPDPQIAALIRTGRAAMPAHQIADPEMTSLLAYLHTLRLPPDVNQAAARVVTVNLVAGGTLHGTVLNETNFDMQLAGDDGRIHLLVRDGEAYREPPLLEKADWSRYDGSYTSSRSSALRQINSSNVQHLELKWLFPISWAPRLEGTPVVLDGIMYVTAANAAYALDAVTGRQLWSYRRPTNPGLLSEAAGGANRGVAVVGSRVLMLTDNAHLIALDRTRGTLLWDVAMTDWPASQYSATGAPFAIGEHVIVGVAGGEEGARGFVASYSVVTGKRDWQFWTIPKPGEKLSETWVGSALEHGCGATWMSGSYDPKLDLLYWAVGNPCPDFNGEERQGDNLYTDSVLALKPESGELKWYFQFTPHDTYDWDADEPLVLLDQPFHGQPRQLLVQANRNGYFVVLDRTDGKFLSATPFVAHPTWTSGYSPEGRPLPAPEPPASLPPGTSCPSSGSNWMSAAFNPALKLYYVWANDSCSIIKLIPAPFKMGERFFNGTPTAVPGRRAIRALDLETGKTVWNYWQTPGRGSSWSGTLFTAGGLVFFGEDSGLFTALDAKTGAPLWHFAANQNFRASPMTYMVGGQQFVAIAGSAGYMAFALSH
jgi:alcohol dehydrogenase (cytochrome c)